MAKKVVWLSSTRVFMRQKISWKMQPSIKLETQNSGIASKHFLMPTRSQKMWILLQKLFHPIVNPLTGWKGGMQIETSSPLAPLIFKCSQLTGSQQLSTLRSVDKLQYKDHFFFLSQPPNLALKLHVCFVFEVRWG